MRRALAWIAGLALVALAALVGEVALSDAEQQAPFVVAAEVGERAEARSFAVIVRQVRATEHVADAEGWEAEGSWLVVDLDAELLRTETAGILSHAQLQVGDRSISASERPSSLAATPLDLGLPQSGSLAFELPADVTSGAATLRLARSGELRLDSVVELAIDLGAVERVPSIELEETRWAS